MLGRQTGLKMLSAILLLLALLPAGVHAQEPEGKVTDALLGVRIGATEAEYRATLASRGVAQRRPTAHGGYKEVWTLQDEQFSSLALRADKSGRVVWVTAFVRPGQEIPFARLGDLSRATVRPQQAVWDVDTPHGGYRLLAKGQNSKARVITLLALPEQRMD